MRIYVGLRDIVAGYDDTPQSLIEFFNPLGLRAPFCFIFRLQFTLVLGVREKILFKRKFKKKLFIPRWFIPRRRGPRRSLLRTSLASRGVRSNPSTERFRSARPPSRFRFRSPFACRARSWS